MDAQNTFGLYQYAETLSDEQIFDLLNRHPHLRAHPRLEWIAETYSANRDPHRAPVAVLIEDCWLEIAKRCTPGTISQLTKALPMLNEIKQLNKIARKYRSDNMFSCRICHLRSNTMPSLRQHYAMTHTSPLSETWYTFY